MFNQICCRDFHLYAVKSDKIIEIDRISNNFQLAIPGSSNFIGRMFIKLNDNRSTLVAYWDFLQHKGGSVMNIQTLYTIKHA